MYNLNLGFFFHFKKSQFVYLLNMAFHILSNFQVVIIKNFRTIVHVMICIVDGIECFFDGRVSMVRCSIQNKKKHLLSSIETHLNV